VCLGSLIAGTGNVLMTFIYSEPLDSIQIELRSDDIASILFAGTVLNMF
jgi:hypothetical protein